MILAVPSKLTPPILRAVASLVALAALPVVAIEAVPDSLVASNDVVVIATLADPSNEVAVPVTAPKIAIVLAV